MAKKQSRRSVSLSRNTYERLRAFCESSGVSMSQFVEGRIGDFLGQAGVPTVVAQRPVIPAKPAPAPMVAKPVIPAAAPAPVVAKPVIPAAPVPAPIRPSPVLAAPSRPVPPPPRPVAPPAPPKPPAGPTERTKVSGTAKAKAEEIAAKRSGNVFNF